MEYLKGVLKLAFPPLFVIVSSCANNIPHDTDIADNTSQTSLSCEAKAPEDPQASIADKKKILLSTTPQSLNNIWVAFEIVPDSDKLEALGAIETLIELYKNVANGTPVSIENLEDISKSPDMNTLIESLKVIGVSTHAIEMLKSQPSLDYDTVNAHADSINILNTISNLEYLSNILLSAKIEALYESFSPTSENNDIDIERFRTAARFKIILNDATSKIEEFLNTGELNITSQDIKEEYHYLLPVMPYLATQVEADLKNNKEQEKDWSQSMSEPTLEPPKLTYL